MLDCIVELNKTSMPYGSPPCNLVLNVGVGGVRGENHRNGEKSIFSSTKRLFFVGQVDGVSEDAKVGSKSFLQQKCPKQNRDGFNRNESSSV